MANTKLSSALSALVLAPVLVLGLTVALTACGGSSSPGNADDDCKAGCLIEGVCFADQASKPGDPCWICDVSRAASEWSSNDGAACDDGLSCTVSDTCQSGACHGVGGGSDSTACFIDGQCFPNHVWKVGDVCWICDVARSTTAWSPNDGMLCDDGKFCTQADACLDGVCTGIARDCSDGVTCTGQESCDEELDRCVAGTTTCAGNQLCEAASDACVTVCRDCIIGGVCYPAGTVSPLNTCERCDPLASKSDWTANDGAACDDGIAANGDDTCSARSCSTHACDDSPTCVYFVRNGLADYTGHDGRTWSAAFASVQQGLNAAEAYLQVNGGAGCEVWVAATGTAYLPTEPLVAADARTRTIQLKAHVALLGGFVGTEHTSCERDIVNNETILSGDIGVAGNSGDNAYHVVTGADAAVLDGFTIRDGRANGITDNIKRGGGMYNSACAPVVRDCLFSANYADNYGGGMYNDAASPTVTHCSFVGNSAQQGSGIANFNGSAPNISDCSMHDQSASGGCGMYNELSSAEVSHCFFINNSATNGGGLAESGSSSLVTNCLFSGNSASGGGGAIHIGSSSTKVKNSVFKSNFAFDFGGAMKLVSSPSAEVTNCTFFANSTHGSGGGVSTLNSSFALTSCILWGDSNGELNLESGNAPVVSYSDVQMTAGNVYAGTGNINADPLFVDPGNGDLRLQASSPCIDAASDAAAPAKDMKDNARYDFPDVGTSIADMGAYEYRP